LESEVFELQSKVSLLQNQPSSEKSALAEVNQMIKKFSSDWEALRQWVKERGELNNKSLGEQLEDRITNEKDSIILQVSVISDKVN